MLQFHFSWLRVTYSQYIACRYIQFCKLSNCLGNHRVVFKRILFNSPEISIVKATIQNVEILLFVFTQTKLLYYRETLNSFVNLYYSARMLHDKL